MIRRLASATDCVRRRSRTANPVSLRDELIRLRRIVDRIELEFATVAGAFAATEEEEWQGCLSPLHWMRLECGMSAAAASSAIAVGSQADSLSESIAAVEDGRLGFAHLALMAGTARAFQASPTAIPFEEQPLLDQAVNHTLSRFRVDCAHARHAHDAQAFQAEQLRDVDYRMLEVRTGEGGAVFIKGFLDPVGGATLCTALDPLASSAGSDDDRPRGRRYADALVELAGHGLDASLLPRVGGQRPHLQVTTSLVSGSVTSGRRPCWPTRNTPRRPGRPRSDRRSAARAQRPVRTTRRAAGRSCPKGPVANRASCIRVPMTPTVTVQTMSDRAVQNFQTTTVEVGLTSTHH